MYSQIDRNKFLTFLLVAGFIAIVGTTSLVIGYVWSGDILASFAIGVFAFFISLIGGLISYFGGAQLVLGMTGAIDITGNSQYHDLLDRIETLSIKAGLPKPKVYIIPDAALNAFATGRNPENGHVALTQGILQALTPDELEAVIAHELGHIKNYDIRLMLIVSVLAGVLTTLSDFFLRSLIWGGVRRDNHGGGANPIMIVIGIAFALLAPLVAVIVQLAISRRREFLADMTAVEITRYPQSMINALRKLQSDTRPVAKATEGNAHMFIDFPLRDSGNFIRKLFSTHPPIEERIEALQQI